MLHSEHYSDLLPQHPKKRNAIRLSHRDRIEVSHRKCESEIFDQDNHYYSIENMLKMVLQGNFESFFHLETPKGFRVIFLAQNRPN